MSKTSVHGEWFSYEKADPHPNEEELLALPNRFSDPARQWMLLKFAGLTSARWTTYREFVYPISKEPPSLYRHPEWDEIFSGDGADARSHWIIVDGQPIGVKMASPTIVRKM